MQPPTAEKNLRRPFAVFLLLLLAAAVWAREKESARPAEAPPAERTAPEAPPPRQAWTGFPVVELGPPPHVWRGKPISLSLRDADLVEVLRSFAKLTDANIVIDPQVKGRVTVELKEVPWDQALYVILKTQGLGVEITGNVWAFQARQALAKPRP